MMRIACALVALLVAWSSPAEATMGGGNHIEMLGYDPDTYTLYLYLRHDGETEAGRLLCYDAARRQLTRLGLDLPLSLAARSDERLLSLDKHRLLEMALQHSSLRPLAALSEDAAIDRCSAMPAERMQAPGQDQPCWTHTCELPGPGGEINKAELRSCCAPEIRARAFDLPAPLKTRVWILRHRGPCTAEGCFEEDELVIVPSARNSSDTTCEELLAGPLKKGAREAARVLTEAGRRYRRRGQLANAARLLGLARELDPGSADAALCLAAALALQGKPEQALQQLCSAFAFDPAATKKRMKTDRAFASLRRRAGFAALLRLPGLKSKCAYLDACSQCCTCDAFYPLGWSRDGKFAYLEHRVNYDMCWDNHIALVVLDCARNAIAARASFSAAEELERGDSLGRLLTAHRKPITETLEQHAIVLGAPFRRFPAKVLGLRLACEKTSLPEAAPRDRERIERVVLESASPKQRWTLYDERVEGGALGASEPRLFVSPFSEALVIFFESEGAIALEACNRAIRYHVLGATKDALRSGEWSPAID
ncbi:MAG: hypothetical protein JXR96_07770 [Deltaproteobacteria bacterium]|nr:hypothetical protein [Deltaproteobacteria bacterium]